jgi:hypothetical protein
MTSSVLPSYEVEFIPVERRLGDRRANPNAGLPPGVSVDRRKGDRREMHGTNQKSQSAR